MCDCPYCDYDFTSHHIDVTCSASVMEAPKFGIKTSTILFLEGPSVANAANITSMLDENLRNHFGVDFNSIRKNFTIVTDGAAVMARVAVSSVSTRIATLDEKSM